MDNRQTFVTAGGFDGSEADNAWFVNASEAGRHQHFKEDHEECDTRVWFYARHFKKAIICSPDTDTFLIGLPLISQHGLSIVVRVDTPGAKDRQYLDVNKLLDSIVRDPDLATIPAEHRASAITAAYVASGCDFTSFFAGIGESTFFRSLFQHAAFIYGTGVSLHEPSSVRSFPTFSRLVAAAYYTRHRSAFNVSLPDLFASLSTETSHSQLSQHLFFVDELRKIIWPRTSSEEECLQSGSALQLHWSRCCWVLRVWSQACSSSLDVPAPTEHGWCVDTTGQIEVTWDTEESIA